MLVKILLIQKRGFFLIISPIIVFKAVFSRSYCSYDNSVLTNDSAVFDTMIVESSDKEYTTLYELLILLGSNHLQYNERN